jgi:hypothetical protein
VIGQQKFGRKLRPENSEKFSEIRGMRFVQNKCTLRYHNYVYFLDKKYVSFYDDISAYLFPVFLIISGRQFLDDQLMLHVIFSGLQ